MINLPDVTLIIASSIKIRETIRAVVNSSSKILFGDIKILTDKEIISDTKLYKVEIIKRLDNIDDYNRFIFFDLNDYVKTNYCLVIQYDSEVIHPNLWNSEWLAFDYIGAPWAYREDAYICKDTGEHVRVGNGGFSLRSKKLLGIPSKHKLSLLEEQGFYSEDGNICVYHRKKMLELGIKYAPLEQAIRFSYETPIPENYGVPSFGYHKNINWW